MAVQHTLWLIAATDAAVPPLMPLPLLLLPYCCSSPSALFNVRIYARFVAPQIPLFFSSTGIKTFDTTLAWTRILPGGTGTKPNKAGVDYYRRMAEATHKAGGTFTATLYHWDLPEVL